MLGNFFLSLCEIVGADIGGLTTLFGLRLTKNIFLTQYNFLNYKSNFRLMLNLFSHKATTIAIDALFKNAG